MRNKIILFLIFMFSCIANEAVNTKKEKLDCFVSNIYGENILTKAPIPGETYIVCGTLTYKVLSYRARYANTCLGGHIPRKRTLKDIGCVESNGKIECLERRKFDEGCMPGIETMREMVLLQE
jgi:hypothetical protein